MTYFRDLSAYTYRPSEIAGAQNIGWLAADFPFETEAPNPEDLNILWEQCKIGVNATRGLHACDFCSKAKDNNFRFVRNGETLLLGFSEIRVISLSGQSFAAPSLIYHYMSDHRYRPPSVFLEAMRTGLPPSSPAYFEGLRTRQLEWRSTVRSA